MPDWLNIASDSGPVSHTASYIRLQTFLEDNWLLLEKIITYKRPDKPATV